MSEPAENMKTVTVFQKLLPLLDFPFEEEIKIKQKKVIKTKMELTLSIGLPQAAEPNPASTMVQVRKVEMVPLVSSLTDVLPIINIKDIGCAIIQAAVTELRELAKDRFWQSAGRHFSKRSLCEQEEAIADLKSFFYGEGLVDVIDCYGLENLTAEIIQNGVDPIFEEFQRAAIC